MRPGFLKEAGKKFGERTAIEEIPTGRKISYSTLAAISRAAVAEAGIDGPVATIAQTSADHAPVLLGALDAGAIAVPLSPRLPRDAALRRAADAGAKRLWEHGRWSPVPNAQPPPGQGPGTILFSSGSMGTPKALYHPLEAHFHSARAAGTRIPLEPQDRWWVNLPLHHVSGFAILIRCIQAGACAVFAEDPRNRLPPGITHVSAVSLQLDRWLSSPPPPSLKAVLVGGGPAPNALIEEAVRKGWPIHLTYGMTEAASQVATTERLDVPPGPLPLDAGTPLPGWEVRIPPGGEIALRGPSLAVARSTKSGIWEPISDPDGWMATGDLGQCHPNGRLKILGRADRMFTSGGENIHPEAIELRLAAIPGVARCAVVGIPHPLYGTRPVAFLAGTCSPEAASLALAQSLEPFAIPDAFLPWPEDIDPQTEKIPYRKFEEKAVTASKNP